MAVIAITKAHHNLFRIIKRVFQTNERTVISRKGEKVAAIIGPDDMNLLDQIDELEDKALADIAAESMEDPGENITFENLKKQFNRS